MHFEPGSYVFAARAKPVWAGRVCLHDTQTDILKYQNMAHFICITEIYFYL